MGERLDAPQRLRDAVFRLENDQPLQRIDSARLTGNAEFLPEIRADMRNRLDNQLILTIPPGLRRRITA